MDYADAKKLRAAEITKQFAGDPDAQKKLIERCAHAEVRLVELLKEKQLEKAAKK